MYIDTSGLIVLFILAYLGIGFIITLIVRKKKKEPLKKSDIFDKNPEGDWKNIAREVNKLNKHLSFTRSRLMPFKEVKFFVYIVVDEKLNILGCYFEKELAEYIATGACPENENRFIQEIEVKNGI